MSIDEKNLELLRLFTIEKSRTINLLQTDSVLEIGPPRLEGAHNSPAFYLGDKIQIVDICFTNIKCKK